MPQLGRIAGHLLEQNLKRDNVDIKFSNTTFDPTSLLYLDVVNGQIGIKNDTPAFDLDISSDIITTDVNVDSSARIGNIEILANGTVSTTVGPLIINPAPVSQNVYNLTYIDTTGLRGLVEGQWGAYVRDVSTGTPVYWSGINSNTYLQNLYFKIPQGLIDEVTSAGDTVYISNASTNEPIFGFRAEFDTGPGNSIFFFSIGYIWIEVNVSVNKNWNVAYPPSIAAMPNTNSTERLEIQKALAVHLKANVSPNDTVTWTKGPRIASSMPTMTFDRLESDDLYITDNIIGSKTSSASVTFEAAGTGSVDVSSNTNIYGDLSATGNITIDGDLSNLGTITIGDSPLDVVVIAPDLTQDIVPGGDLQHELGQQANDSTARKWASLWTPTLVNVDQNRPYRALVSDQLLINGVTNEIFATQSDDFVELNPDTGITYIEDTKWETNNITNLNGTTPLKFGSTGAGYLRFMDTNAFRLPAGGDASRPSVPELGDMRWNTDRDYMECFAGEIDNVSYTGATAGLPDQIQYPVTASSTSGSGFGANFRFTVTGGVLTIEITSEGTGFNVGDTLTVLGTNFTGGTSPANDITITVGSQVGDGYRRATGGGEEVNETLMEQLAIVYDLMLG